MTRHRLLASAAAVALLVATTRAANASILSVLTDILTFCQTYVVPLLADLAPMPPTIDGPVLAGTQQPIGQAPGSYVTGALPSGNPLFPIGGNPEWVPPDGAATYAGMRFIDRLNRADEAEAEATAVITDDQAATARLEGFVVRNAVPDESVTGSIKLGTDVQVETAGQLHKLTQLQAEANQLEADQRVQEDWARQQIALYNRTTLANGYWGGMKTWQPDQLGGGG